MSAAEILLATPLFGVAATVCAYAVAAAVHRALGGPALLHPVITATGAMALCLHVAGIDYQTYFRQAHPLHLALGVVVVLLAVPLWRQFHLIRAARWTLGVTLVVGSLTALATALAFPILTAAPDSLLATLAAKSTTTAVAVQVSERLGGVPALTALVVISSGIFGAAFGPPILRSAGVIDERAVGFAMGLASHVIGTARACQISDVAGAFASIGMILNAVLTILLVPLVLGGW